MTYATREPCRITQKTCNGLETWITACSRIIYTSGDKKLKPSACPNSLQFSSLVKAGQNIQWLEVEWYHQVARQGAAGANDEVQNAPFGARDPANMNSLAFLDEYWVVSVVNQHVRSKGKEAEVPISFESKRREVLEYVNAFADSRGVIEATRLAAKQFGIPEGTVKRWRHEVVNK